MQANPRVPNAARTFYRWVAAESDTGVRYGYAAQQAAPPNVVDVIDEMKLGL